MMTKGGYMQDDDERLLRFANEWKNNKNNANCIISGWGYVRVKCKVMRILI